MLCVFVNVIQVMFYLGKYIMSKELYDKQQQHIVHCGNNALGAVFGVASFSVKEPRALFAMISKHLIAVKIPESQSTFREGRALSEADQGPEETNPRSSTSTQQQQQQRRRRRSSDPSEHTHTKPKQKALTLIRYRYRSGTCVCRYAQESAGMVM
ncbi:hypothetical protein PGIGA_G00095060 [Pangasianodon gigas]|uniref:Uncharacterized protein n=1 Tax=Pangasianodon gigas TaxID=30993 RepID=A0ACC5XCY8_PANGG|nr:hypothetical protein [Pangasianodon gigas]